MPPCPPVFSCLCPSYYFCKTNENALSGRGSNDWWDYCSLSGFTTHHSPCTDECAQHGKDYYWCHKSTGSWDYCSPPGRAKPVQRTIYGSRCISECVDHGRGDYYWCNRNIRSCDSKSCTARWDYCSPDEHHTRFNKECTEECARNGESYYWCYRTEGGWDYCSPANHYKDYDYTGKSFTRVVKIREPVNRVFRKLFQVLNTLFLGKTKILYPGLTHLYNTMTILYTI